MANERTKMDRRTKGRAVDRCWASLLYPSGPLVEHVALARWRGGGLTGRATTPLSQADTMHDLVSV